LKSDKDVISAPFDHLEMLKRPHLWPAWPYLPLKRWHKSTMNCAVVAEDEGDKVRFYEGADLWNPESFKEPGVLRAPKEIIADGWVVD
jgi:hypothetical protein